MYRKYLVCLFVLGLLAGPACTYNVEEELYPSNSCETEDVTFTADIMPVIQNICVTCHNQLVTNGNVNLDGHSNVKIVAENGRLLGAIRHDNGFAAMPQDQSRLPDCTIEKFEAWVAGGALDN
jgi:hypothetical protein